MLAAFAQRFERLGNSATARANLIASENRQSPFVRSFLATDAASRYSFAGSEGAGAFPGGNVWAEFQIEGEAALGRIGQAKFVNMRPLSGLHAMTVAILALTEPGDRIISLSPEAGGHYATGGLARRLGRQHHSAPLCHDGEVDADGLSRALEQFPPALLYLDQCHGLIPLDIARIAQVARLVRPGVLIHADVSHSLGLILGQGAPNPLATGCDSYGGSTHKTFPGPQKGVLLTNRQDLAVRFTAAQYELISNHHLNVSLALSAALLEFEECGGFEYAGRLAPNAQLFAATLAEHGIPPVVHAGHHTAWHQIWIANDALPGGAEAAAKALRENAIMVNLLKDLPGLKPFGLRLGVSEITHLGLSSMEVAELAALMARIVQAGRAVPSLRQRVVELIMDAPRPYDYSSRRPPHEVGAPYDYTGAYAMPWRGADAAGGSPVFVRANGCYVEDGSGRRWLDAKSGALNATLGFAREDLAAAAHRQLVEMPSNDVTSSLNAPALRLAERIAGLAGGSLGRTLFCNSGSEATEAALKIAVTVARSRGKWGARKLICFEGGYHGCTQGALAVSGIEFPKTGLDFCDAALARRVAFPTKPCDLVAIKALLASPEADQLAGVILEPVQGIGGIRPFRADVLAGLRSICNEAGLILVFDEIFTGFGRTGRTFAYQHAGVFPDVLLTSKGLTAGYSPLSAVTMTEVLYDTFLGSDPFGALRHGHTMSGNAVACAVANSVLDRIEAENLTENARETGVLLTQSLTAGIDPAAAWVRGIGLMIGIDVGDQPLAEAIVRDCERNGVLVRAQSGVVQLAPPMTIGPAAISKLSSVIIRAVNTCTGPVAESNHDG